MMKMNKLATLFLTTTLTLASGAALAADSTSQTNNGGANAAADAGQMAPDAHQNVMPKNTDGSDVNSGSTNAAGGTMLHPSNPDSATSANTSASGDTMSKDDIHKNSQCKDGKCPDINEKVQTGDGINNDTNTKTDGTSQ